MERGWTSTQPGRPKLALCSPIESLFTSNQIEFKLAGQSVTIEQQELHVSWVYLTSFFLHSVLLLLEVEQSPGNIIFHSTRDIKG